MTTHAARAPTKTLRTGLDKVLDLLDTDDFSPAVAEELTAVVMIVCGCPLPELSGFFLPENIRLK
ncbi:MAG: hypothetical protein ACKO0V_20560, partial [bacterium]